MLNIGSRSDRFQNTKPDQTQTPVSVINSDTKTVPRLVVRGLCADGGDVPAAGDAGRGDPHHLQAEPRPPPRLVLQLETTIHPPSRRYHRGRPRGNILRHEYHFR